MRNLSVLTNQLTADAILESWFMQNTVLQQIPFGLEWELEGLKDGVVIYLEVGEINEKIIATLRAGRNKVVLCQMGDEFLTKYNRDAYLACDLVLRNYYFPEIFADPEVKRKTLWIPNGFKSGVGPREPAMVRSASQRRFLSCFLGWLDNGASYANERAIFQKVAAECPQDLLLSPTPSFGKGYNVGMYSTIMEYSVFCPCPAGNSPETIRLYDALELGCIPISLKHEFLRQDDALGIPPFPLLDNWEELPGFLRQQRTEIARDPKVIGDIQHTCVVWWDVVKKSAASSISKRLLELRIR